MSNNVIKFDKPADQENQEDSQPLEDQSPKRLGQFRMDGRFFLDPFLTWMFHSKIKLLGYKVNKIMSSKQRLICDFIGMSELFDLLPYGDDIPKYEIKFIANKETNGYTEIYAERIMPSEG